MLYAELSGDSLAGRDASIAAAWDAAKTHFSATDDDLELNAWIEPEDIGIKEWIVIGNADGVSWSAKTDTETFVVVNGFALTGEYDVLENVRFDRNTDHTAELKLRLWRGFSPNVRAYYIDNPVMIPADGPWQFRFELIGESEFIFAPLGYTIRLRKK